MAYYAGIDLGTTNSAIATWDGSTLKLWKSPEQNDVTPSAIYFDRRGRYVGKRAYDFGQGYYGLEGGEGYVDPQGVWHRGRPPGRTPIGGW